MGGFGWGLMIWHSFKGFMQIYQLQTENDEEETWRDLVCTPVLQMLT